MTNCQHEWAVEKQAEGHVQSRCVRCGEIYERQQESWWSIGDNAIGLWFLLLP